MKGRILLTAALLGLGAVAQAQQFNMSPNQMTAAQKKSYSDKAKAFTGKTCAQFTMYSAMPAGTAASFNAGVQAMTSFQAKQGIKSLKKQQTGTVFQQHAQQGAKQQYIYNGLVSGTTTTVACELK